MQPDLMILFEPLIDDRLSLACCAKPFGVENFSVERAVEALVMCVRPKFAGLERCLDGLTSR